MLNNITTKVSNLLQNVVSKCKISGTVTADPGTSNQTFLAYSRATGELIGSTVWDAVTHQYVIYLSSYPDEGIMLTRRDESGLYFAETYDRLSLCNETFVHGPEYNDLQNTDRSIIMAASKPPLSYPFTIQHENLKKVSGSLYFDKNFKEGVLKVSGNQYSLPRKIRGCIYADNDIIIYEGNSNYFETGNINPALNPDPFGDGSLMACYPMNTDGKDCTGNYPAIDYEPSRFNKGGYNFYYGWQAPFTIPIVITRAATRTVVFSFENYNWNSINHEIFTIPGLLYVSIYNGSLYFYSIAGSTWTSALAYTLLTPIYSMVQVAVVISSSGVDKLLVSGACVYTKAVGVPTVTNTQYLSFHGLKNTSTSEIVVKNIMIFNRELLPNELGSLWNTTNSKSSIPSISTINASVNSSTSLSLIGSNLTTDLKARFPLTNGNIGNILGGSSYFSAMIGLSLYSDRFYFNGTTKYLSKSKILGWFDADDVSTITIATGVSKWLDKSGNGNSFIQATTTYQPTRQTNIINGRAVVRLEGTDDVMATTAKLNAQVVSIFHIQRTTDTKYITYSDGTNNFSYVGIVDSADSSISLTVSSWRPSSMFIDGLLSSVTSRASVYTALNNRNALVSLIGVDIVQWVAFKIGGYATWYPAIDLGEIIIVSGIPTKEVQQGIEGFLANRWGTTGALPASHPYKSVAPTGTLEEIVAGTDRIDASATDIYIRFFAVAVTTVQCIWKKGYDLEGIAIGLDSTSHVTLYARNSNVLTSSSFTTPVTIAAFYRFELKGSNMTFYNDLGEVIETKAHGLTFANYQGSESIGAAFGGSPITGTSGNSGFFNGHVCDITFADANTIGNRVVDSENSVSVYAGETELPVEVVKWDMENNEAILWTSIPELSSTEDTVLTISSEIPPIKSGVTGTNKASQVWDTDYVGVYHMIPDSVLKDSTANHFDGELLGIDLSNFIAHDTGYSLNLNGTDEYAKIKYPVLSDSQRACVTALFRCDTIANGVRLLDLALSDSQDSSQQLNLQFDASNQLTASFKDTSGTLIGDVTSGVLGTVADYNATVNYDGKSNAGSLELFVDNVSADTTTPTGNRIANNAGLLHVGKDAYSGTYFDGKLAELHISKKQRSEDWNKVIDLSMRDNLGTYELVAGGSVGFKVTIPSGTVGSSLVDFPLLINFSPIPLSSEVDVRTQLFFSCKDPTKLIFKQGTIPLSAEIEQWDAVSKKCVFHVKVPTVSSSVDTVIDVIVGTEVNTLIGYVGSTAAQGVWDTNYIAVYHMSEQPLLANSVINSVLNGVNLSPNGSMTAEDLVISETYGSSLDFDGVNDYLSNSLAIPSMTSFSIDVFFKRTGTSRIDTIFHKGDYSVAGNFGVGLYSDSSGAYSSTGLIFIQWFNSTWKAADTSFLAPTGSLTSLSISINSTNMLSNVNGVGSSTTLTNVITTGGAYPFKVGAEKALSLQRYFQGEIYEFRISSISRSADWLKLTSLCLKGDVNTHEIVTAAVEEIIPAPPIRHWTFDFNDSLEQISGMNVGTVPSALFSTPGKFNKYIYGNTSVTGAGLLLSSPLEFKSISFWGSHSGNYSNDMCCFIGPMFSAFLIGRDDYGNNVTINGYSIGKTIRDTNWHLFTLVEVVENSYEVYVDSILYGIFSTTGLINGGVISFFGYNGAVSGAWRTGRMCNIMIFDYALNTDQINELYTASLSTTYPTKFVPSTQPPATANFIIPSTTVQNNQKNIPVMLRLSASSGLSNLDVTSIFNKIKADFLKVSGTNPKYNEFGFARNGSSNYDYPLMPVTDGPRFEKNGSVRFGSSVYIDITNSISRSLLSGTITVSLLVYPELLSASETVLFGTGSEFQISYTATSGRLIVRHTSTSATTSVSVMPNRWNHIIVLRDIIAKTITVYQDKYQSYYASYTTQPTVSAIGIYIGATTFTGRIADIQIFNRILTATEINDLFNNSGYSIYKDNFTTSLLKQDVPVLLGENLTSIQVTDNSNSIDIIRTYNNAQPWKLQYDLNTSQSTDIADWQTESGSLPGALAGACSVVTKNRAYLLGGGATCSTMIAASNKVYTAPIDVNGILGTWVADTPLPYDVAYASVVMTFNRVYLLGGSNSGGTTIQAVYTAPINSDGTLGSWVLSDKNLPTPIRASSVLVAANTVYLIGGDWYNSPSGVTTIWKATIAADGTLGDWSVYSLTLPIAITGACIAVIKNKVYLFGKYTYQNNTSYTHVYSATVDEEGVLGTFALDSHVLPSNAGQAQMSAVVTKGKLYILGGYNATSIYRKNVCVAPINTSGVLGDFSISTATMPIGGDSASVFVTSSRLYLAGGSYTPLSTVVSAPFTGGFNDYTDKTFSGIYGSAMAKVVCYSLSIDGLTYKAFNSTWKSIASSDPAVHGHTGDSVPYYWDNDSQEWVYSNSSIEEAISNAMVYPENRMGSTALTAITDFSPIYSSSTGLIHIATSLWSDGTSKPEITSIKINNKNYWLSDLYLLSDYCTTVSESSVNYSFALPDSTNNYRAATKLYCWITGGTQWVECVDGTIPNVPVGLTTAGKSIRFRLTWDLTTWVNPADISIEVLIK